MYLKNSLNANESVMMSKKSVPQATFHIPHRGVLFEDSLFAAQFLKEFFCELN